MTVASSRTSTLTHYSTILNALKSCQQAARQTNTAQIASLSFPLPTIDPLTVLLTQAETHQRQCYFESPSRGKAIAAWDTLISDRFSGRDRFQAARHYLESWQDRVQMLSGQREGPYFFCSFSFFDTMAEAASGFSPATVLLTRWQVVRQNRRSALIANILVSPRTLLAPQARAIAEQLSELRRSAVTKPLQGSPPWQATPLEPRLSQAEGDRFQHNVRQTLQAIQANQLQKQVVAHALDISREADFQRATALPRLRSQHPDCYIFSFSGTRNDHFIGASPERLLSIHQGRLVTDALAGSAPRGHTSAEDYALGQQLLDSVKEQREHQLVLEFILERLRAQGLSPRYSTPPGLLRLSHIQHLHTPICADVAQNVSPLALVEALHPTPAVAGVPTQTACDLIRREESCDRGLYAAPLGWVDPHGNSEFIVGIRSALIQGNRARLYAGAGIVDGSSPEKELAEIQLKLQAIAEALG